MTERTPENWWDNLDTSLPEPGSKPDLDHGLPGDAEEPE